MNVGSSISKRNKAQTKLTLYRSDGKKLKQEFDDSDQNISGNNIVLSLG